MDRNLTGPRLRLLGAFTLRTTDRLVRLPLGAQRLVAFVATNARPRPRAEIAERLWPDLPEPRAAATMRSALWQVRRRVPGVIKADIGSVVLGASTDVDLWRATGYARALQNSGEGGCWQDFLDDLDYDLLPHWPDDWLVLERERYRQIRLHALEALGRELTRSGLTQHAIEVAQRAVAADPLRETAQRVLIEAHLADGNLSEAIRQYQAYAGMLRHTLGVTPTSALRALLPTVTRQRME